jgi:hypothetical protein
MAYTKKGYMAVIAETTAGTAVKPTHFLRFPEGNIKAEQTIIKNMSIQNNRHNSLNYFPGKINTDVSMTFEYDYTDSVYWLYGVLGGLTSADISSDTDTTVYSHTMVISDTSPSFTLEQAWGATDSATTDKQEYQVDRLFGAYVDSVEISASDETTKITANFKALGSFDQANLIADAGAGATVALQLDSVGGLVAADTVRVYDETPQSEADAIAAVSTSAKTITIATLGNSYTIANNARVTLEPQTATYNTFRPCMFHHWTFKTGSDVSAADSASAINRFDWTLSIMNNGETYYGTNVLTGYHGRGPALYAKKGFDATLKFRKYFTTKDDQNLFLESLGKAIVLEAINNEIVSDTDTNDRKYGLRFEISEAVITKMDRSSGSDDVIMLDIEMDCKYNSSDARAIRAIAYNGSAGTVYTA